MEIAFRRLSACDLALALRMNESFRPGLIEEKSAARFLSGAGNWLFAALFKGEVIGFAYGWALPRLDAGLPMLYVHELGVASAWQRQGVGTQMLRALFISCRAAGIGKVFLYTQRDNAAANALYQRLGGEPSRDSAGNDVVYYFKTE